MRGGHARRERNAAPPVEAPCTSNFVQLAADLSDCMAFEPKRWRQVLDKSSAVLQTSSNALQRVRASGDNAQLQQKQHNRNHKQQLQRSSMPASRQPLTVKTRPAAARKPKHNNHISNIISSTRSSSRDEDSDCIVLPSVHPTDHSQRAPMSVAAYLRQPELVRAILEAEMPTNDSRDDISDNAGDNSMSDNDSDAGASDVTDDHSTINSVETTQALDTLVSSPLTSPRVTDAVRLPLLSTMSPRTRRGLARLPAPSADDLDAVDALEHFASSKQLAYDFYHDLQQQQQRRRALHRVQHAPLASPSYNKHQATRTLLPAATATTKQAYRPQVVVHRNTMRDEQALMAIEDVNANHLSVPVASVAPSSQTVTNTSDQLRREQASAVAAELVAQQHVTQTLTEIRQLLPLELVYAFGHGTFASAAQQRAAHVLARASVRLRLAHVANAMQQWQRVTALAAQQAKDAAALCIQCAWRMAIAKHELAVRRRVRLELHKRQLALVQLLASKQNHAASLLTRVLRRYVYRCRRCRLALQHAAAVRIQQFWRQRQALWVALRIQLRKQQRLRAALTIQRVARGRLARRRRNLLRKLQRVEAARRYKQQQVAARKRLFELTGAALLLQRTIRKWQQRRVLALRRRRKQFERDKIAIVKVQARFRGRATRKWVQTHAVAVQRAVLTLQRAWRCFIARRALAIRQQQRTAQRRAWTAEIAERRRRLQPRGRAAQQVKKTWQQVAAIKDKVLSPMAAVAAAATPPHPREVRAATLLQARWRGISTRRRLRYAAARRRERQRRAINRLRRLGATTIQRRVRGIHGRVAAWRRMVHRSAQRIQSAWRGFCTRRLLHRTRRALLAITHMQQRWRQRRAMASDRQRFRAALAIQARSRVFVARRWLQRAVQRQQRLAEEHAMGTALLAATRARVKDELLLQSFVHRSVALASESSDSARVDRSLFCIDSNSSSRAWTRRGYDGVWQEVFRVASGGGGKEIDNSHFVRFLKALPHGFVDKTSFPTHALDVIFAKMKEPKARSLSFARYTTAMLLVWRDRFAPASSSNSSSSSGKSSSKSPATKGAVAHAHATPDSDDYARFLKFMHRYVLQPTVQHGAFRQLLDAHCTQRVLWSVDKLRRFANCIVARKRHAAFRIAYAQQLQRAKRDASADLIAACYRRVRFRKQLGVLLAKTFVEFIDHTGKAVKFEHVRTHHVVTGARPRLLAGIKCARVVPLPFPGEEFRAWCTRHEDSSSNARVAASIYCVECEDAMCSVCFARDHDKRAAFAHHDTRAIRVCSHCCVETATRECLHCGNGHVPFCDVCFPFVHAASPPNKSTSNATADVLPTKPLDTHAWTALVVMCIECATHVAQWRCETCTDSYCKRCLSRTHARGQRQYHTCQRLSYFSVLQQRAEHTRAVHAQTALAQRDKERADARAQRALELQRRHASATTIQALVRGFVARRRGRTYMKLVRQTQVAKAQRVKDERKRASLVYRLQNVFGVSPALRSDTAQEVEARQQRLAAVQHTLFLHRRVDGATHDNDAASASAFAPRAKRRWTKAARLDAQHAAQTWCTYDARVVIRNGVWRNSVASVLSTQHILTTGHVVVFVPLANRAAVVSYEQLVPLDDIEAAARQPIAPPHQLLADAAVDARAHLTRVVDAAARRARLLFLQHIEFRDIAHTAWIAEPNRIAQRVEYWNVVLNTRSLEPPRAMELIERMDEAQRKALDARVRIARTKLVALLQAFTPANMPALLRRRNAHVFVAGAAAHNSGGKFDTQLDALRCARFWHETLVPHDVLGGKRPRAFLHACTVPPHSTAACWRIMQLWQWLELYGGADGYEPHAKVFLRLPPDVQLFVADEIASMVDDRQFRDASDKFLQLIKQKNETLQLLVFNATQRRAVAEDAAADAATEQT